MKKVAKKSIALFSLLLALSNINVSKADNLDFESYSSSDEIYPNVIIREDISSHNSNSNSSNDKKNVIESEISSSNDKELSVVEKNKDKKDSKKVKNKEKSKKKTKANKKAKKSKKSKKKAKKLKVSQFSLGEVFNIIYDKDLDELEKKTDRFYLKKALLRNEDRDFFKKKQGFLKQEELNKDYLSFVNNEISKDEAYKSQISHNYRFLNEDFMSPTGFILKKLYTAKKPFVTIETKENEDVVSPANGMKVKKVSDDYIILKKKDVEFRIGNVKNQIAEGQIVNIGDKIANANGDVDFMVKHQNKFQNPIVYYYMNLKDDIIDDPMAIDYYIQYDARWGNYRYGDSDIAQAGCGPTSLSMILSYMTDEKINPGELVEDIGGASSGYYIRNVGSSWALFGGVCDDYDIDVYQVSPSSDFIINELNDGNPIIASMSPGYFTSGGHFIVLRGIDNNGNVLVNDPASQDRSLKAYSPNFIVSQAKQLFSFDYHLDGEKSLKLYLDNLDTIESRSTFINF
ncbi:MAG: C39 family peptidase [Tissierellia bacterium]|nr:C39 family peptidase [Tissierellia bacterium]